jgi:hypothetical protein
MAIDIGVEGLRLLMTVGEAAAECDARGWKHDIRSGDGSYSYGPGLPVTIVECKFEKGVLVKIEASYASPQLARAQAFGATLPIKTKAAILGIRAWGAWSADRTVAVLGDANGSTVTAVHLGVLASQREVESLVATYGGDLAPPVRAR